MKIFRQFGIIVFATMVVAYAVHIHSMSKMDASLSFAQHDPSTHDVPASTGGSASDSDHDHISASSTVFKGTIFHITQPGLPTNSQRLIELNTVPSGPWIFQGNWKLKLGPLTDVNRSVEKFKANFSMIRIEEPNKPLASAGADRSWHAMQIEMTEGTVINMGGEKLHVIGMATIGGDGHKHFMPEPIELILSGGGMKNPSRLDIWFDVSPIQVTNMFFTEGNVSSPRNAREHFGGVIFGTVDTEK